MLQSLCQAAMAYTSQDFNHWLSGAGALATGIGTIGLAYAAVRAIPKALLQRHKSEVTIRLYQRVVMRMYREAEASSDGIALSLPADLDALTQLLVKRHPAIGTFDDARSLMDDLMLDDYFKTVVGNQVVERTAKWKPQSEK